MDIWIDAAMYRLVYADGHGSFPEVSALNNERARIMDLPNLFHVSSEMRRRMVAKFRVGTFRYGMCDTYASYRTYIDRFRGEYKLTGNLDLLADIANFGAMDGAAYVVEWADRELSAPTHPHAHWPDSDTGDRDVVNYGYIRPISHPALRRRCG